MAHLTPVDATPIQPQHRAQVDSLFAAGLLTPRERKALHDKIDVAEFRARIVARLRGERFAVART